MATLTAIATSACTRNGAPIAAANADGQHQKDQIKRRGLDDAENERQTDPQRPFVVTDPVERILHGLTLSDSLLFLKIAN
jgi:hypothetical protein